MDLCSSDSEATLALKILINQVSPLSENYTANLEIKREEERMLYSSLRVDPRTPLLSFELNICMTLAKTLLRHPSRSPMSTEYSSMLNMILDNVDLDYKKLEFDTVASPRWRS